jgi:CRISPR-associated protein (TIGR03986 family)
MIDRNSGNPVPCFYLEDSSGGIEAIGHTGIFRLAYLYNVRDFSTQERISNHIDFSTSIFGNLERQSKVFVEDAIALRNKDVELYGEEIYLNILQSPRPTSFQLYLEQPQLEKTPRQNLHNWGTIGGRIRGNKLYWHRPTSDDMRVKHSWVFNTINTTDFNKKKNLLAEPVRPVKKDQCFTSRIRFCNLSKAELGVLLIAIELPDKCYHKLGMGKPLGLGSIQINSELVILNQSKRYQSLFCNVSKTWETGKDDLVKKEDCKEEFILLINKILSTNYQTLNDFWTDDERMKELKAMLQFSQNMINQEKWLEETSYMSIEKPVLGNDGNQMFDDRNRPISQNEYADRSVLGKPTSITNKHDKL